MKKKGFILIELLVVIAIIGLLAILVVVALNSFRAKERDSRRVSDIKQVQNALVIYINEQNTYPAVAAPLTLGTAGISSTLSSGAGFAGTASGTVYMTLVPSNPTPGGADYIYTSLAADGAAACTASPCPKYKITFTLENVIPSLGTGKSCTATQDGTTCS